MFDQDEPKLTEGLVFRICNGNTCAPRGGGAIERAARQYVKRRGLQDEVAIARQYCFGRCQTGPNVLIERWRDGKPNDGALRGVLALNQTHPDAVFELAVSADAIEPIIDRHLNAWRERQ